MRKEEKAEREDISSKLEVHFIENVEESEKSPEEDIMGKNTVEKSASGAADEENAPGKNTAGESAAETAAAKNTAEESAAGESASKVTDEKNTAKESTPETLEAEDAEEPICKVTGEAAHKSHKIRNTLAGLLVVFIAAALFVGYPIGREFFQEESTEGKTVEVTIDQGSTSQEVGQILKEKGVIGSEAAFLLKLYFSEYKGKLRYGTFELNDGMSLSKVIKTLATEDGQKETAFTIPEGYTIEMTAAKLEEEEIMSAQDFLTAVENAAETSKYKDLFPKKEKVFYQLQGYLYPDTYNVTEDMGADELVAMILEEFDKKFDETRQAKASELGMTVEEVLIRASLVQKETEKSEEYPTIAGVIQNRLDAEMKLQFDSTVVYAITEGRYGMSRVLYSDLEVDSPYNTYKHKGLPVGPICNPGIEAIDGVLNAQKHDYLYFQMDATKNDGSNIFSKTYEEHKAASATTSAAKNETEESKTDGTSETDKTDAAGKDTQTTETETDKTNAAGKSTQTTETAEGKTDGTAETDKTETATEKTAGTTQTKKEQK